MNRRDLKNIQILCNLRAELIEEDEAYRSLTLAQTTQKGKEKYIKRLIRIIRDEEARIKEEKGEPTLEQREEYLKRKTEEYLNKGTNNGN